MITDPAGKIKPTRGTSSQHDPLLMLPRYQTASAAPSLVTKKTVGSEGGRSLFKATLHGRLTKRSLFH